MKCIRLNDGPTCQRCAATGAECVVNPTAAQIAKEKDRRAQQTCSARCIELTEEVSTLRQQLSTLASTVSALVERQSHAGDGFNRRTPCSQSSSSTYGHSDVPQDERIRQPNFVGPTRAAFGVHVAETSLARMGIVTGHGRSASPSPIPSTKDATPSNSVLPCPSYTPVDPGVDVLLGFPEAEIVRLLKIYEEEVLSVFPILDIEHLVTNLPHLLNMARKEGSVAFVVSSKLREKDVHILRLAVATAMTHETHGEHPVRDALISVVENDLGRITSATDVDLNDLQIMGMLSIFFCHTEEELFAWRAIGRAVRHALEMGLNHKRSLFESFRDLESRKMATQIFWVVYQLDRRWSFGTSLSFALHDKDIDPDLPEPGPEFPYSKCMIAYGRLCSKVWEALPSYGSTSQRIPRETEEYLDVIVKNWQSSIPDELRHIYTNTEFATRMSAQPRILHRLRTLLHLRGNYMKLLIHRHHVLDHENKRPETKMVQLVVDVAKDSIQVLVDFNRTSDIYKRQPSIYHHYLVSALGVLLLAVCHAPTEFTETCRLSFVAAVELLENLSRHGTASRKLWKSINGVLPFVRSLNLPKDQHSERFRLNASYGVNAAPGALHDGHILHHQTMGSTDVLAETAHDVWSANAPPLEPWTNSEPDIFHVSNDLMNLYDAFGTHAAGGEPLQYDGTANNFEGLTDMSWDLAEISRHFEGLI